MHTPLPIALAAILLNLFVLAQHIGLRSIRSLREAAGVSLTVIATVVTTALIDWIVQRTLLAPLNTSYLRFFIAIALTAAITPLFEAILRSRLPQWLPAIGTLLPLTIAASSTIIAALIYHAPTATLATTLLNAVCCGIGSALLLICLQALRERGDDNATDAFKGPAIDLLNSAFIIVALSGVLSVLQ
jgi:H+/Na+-translocating ferredoxin:NAD+ oxidoreductase subunit A